MSQCGKRQEPHLAPTGSPQAALAVTFASPLSMGGKVGSQVGLLPWGTPQDILTSLAPISTLGGGSPVYQPLGSSALQNTRYTESPTCGKGGLIIPILSNSDTSL